MEKKEKGTKVLLFHLLNLGIFFKIYKKIYKYIILTEIKVAKIERKIMK